MLKSYAITWPYLRANQFYKSFASYYTAIRFPPFKSAKESRPNTDRNQVLLDLFMKSTSRGDHLVSDLDLWLLADSIRPTARTSCLGKQDRSFTTSLTITASHCSTHDWVERTECVLAQNLPGLPRSSKFSIPSLNALSFSHWNDTSYLHYHK